MGAEYLAYPPVVAGGPRANIIHYINNNQTVADGELVLMDAGKADSCVKLILRIMRECGRMNADSFMVNDSPSRQRKKKLFLGLVIFICVFHRKAAFYFTETLIECCSLKNIHLQTLRICYL